MRRLDDLWTELPCDHGEMRQVRTEGGFQVVLWDCHVQDRHGKHGIAVEIWDTNAVPDRVVYMTGPNPDALVYCPVRQAIDSDAALLSAIQLCCHHASHDEDDNPRDPGWDADGLAEEASFMESYLAGDA